MINFLMKSFKISTLKYIMILDFLVYPLASCKGYRRRASRVPCIHHPFRRYFKLSLSSLYVHVKVMINFQNIAYEYLWIIHLCIIKCTVETLWQRVCCGHVQDKTIPIKTSIYLFIFIIVLQIFWQEYIKDDLSFI